VTVLRHGAYLCLRRTSGSRDVPDVSVEALADHCGLANEYDARSGHPAQAFALLKRIDVVHRQIADHRLVAAEAIVHVAAPAAESVDRFCADAMRLLAPALDVHVIRGVVRPTNFTGGAMHEFAYSTQRQQEPGSAMPHAFVVPMRKTPEWWRKSWMERHTYFLPRYDEQGRMLAEGHALAAAAGIPDLMRRTYKHVVEPAPDGEYDFLNYFECAGAGVPVFHSVCAALRDVARNPEWQFVREGPTWQGLRVKSWAELFER
jgi:hypothetical protein